MKHKKEVKKMNLGQRLIALRKEKGLSQEEAADILGVTRQTISKWETDGSTPDFDKIIPLCELYEITTDELLTGKKENQKERAEEKEDESETKKQKRTICLITAILLYFISASWMIVSIPYLKLDPTVACAIFLLICGIATCIIIYANIMYKKEEGEKQQQENKKYKQVEEITSLITVIIYLGISFVTASWHITWFIWIIYALILKIIKLILSLKEDEHE